MMSMKLEPLNNVTMIMVQPKEVALKKITFKRDMNEKGGNQKCPIQKDAIERNN